MILASFLPYLWWALPFLGTLALVVVVASLAGRSRPPRLDDVAMLVRRIDLLELAALLDPMVPSKLRRSLSGRAYRRELGRHIRIVHEYLQRLDHNVRIIHAWLAGESEQIVGKDASRFTARDRLAVEALHLTAQLRRRMLAANCKLLLWRALRLHFWPNRFLPSIPNLRVLHGMNLVASYGRLAEIVSLLSIRNSYHPPSAWPGTL